MERKKANWRAKLFLLTASTLCVGGVVGSAEIYCRYFTRINFLDNSSGLFMSGRYGNTYGNTPNFEGISFGERFFTDENGFRFDPAVIPDRKGDLRSNAILILGDSVTFGPALPEHETVAAALRRAMPDRAIYNASAIGYDTFDYLNAGRAITVEKPEVGTVLLFFCLNDVNDASAQLIRSRTVPEAPQPAPPEPPRSISRVINDHLRSRSKLYLWLKNLLVDTRMTYFRNDLANYERGEENVHKALEPIVDLSNELSAKGIELEVFILPYEVQLRPDAEPHFLKPQEMVTSYMRQSGVDHVDLTPAFKDAGIASDLLFLYADPMHLSRDGMEVLSRSVCRKVAECDPARIAGGHRDTQ